MHSAVGAWCQAVDGTDAPAVAWRYVVEEVCLVFILRCSWCIADTLYDDCRYTFCWCCSARAWWRNVLMPLQCVICCYRHSCVAVWYDAGTWWHSDTFLHCVWVILDMEKTIHSRLLWWYAAAEKLMSLRRCLFLFGTVTCLPTCRYVVLPSAVCGSWKWWYGTVLFYSVYCDGMLLFWLFRDVKKPLWYWGFYLVRFCYSVTLFCLCSVLVVVVLLFIVQLLFSPLLPHMWLLLPTVCSEFLGIVLFCPLVHSGERISCYLVFCLLFMPDDFMEVMMERLVRWWTCDFHLLPIFLHIGGTPTYNVHSFFCAVEKYVVPPLLHYDSDFLPLPVLLPLFVVLFGKAFRYTMVHSLSLFCHTALSYKFILFCLLPFCAIYICLSGWSFILVTVRYPPFTIAILIHSMPRSEFAFCGE